MIAMHPPSMQGHDDLAALLARNLTLDSVPAPISPPKEQEEPKIIYFSQHYTHSAHIVAKPPQQGTQESEQMLQHQQRRASEPPQPEHQAIELILIAHEVDPSALSASQLELFKTADDSQKMRLIELWRIVPPTNSTDNPALAWSSTTVEQEETLARMRYERKLQEEQAGSVMSLDGTPVATPMQAGDGRWIQSQHYMEPYMAAGYGDYTPAQPRVADVHLGGRLSYNPATDPVYQNSNNGIDWAEQRRTMEMENQYGILMAMRESEMEL